MKKRKFLTAEWRNLIMANYIVDPSLLTSYIPPRTELDTWNNNCYVSLVGFMFLKTRVKKMQIPFHSNFPEVNLRFYVRYKQDNEWKRGVVFVSEIVPRRAIAFVANTIFKERYSALPMKHKWQKKEQELLEVEYQWKKAGRWNRLAVTANAASVALQEGSEEEFITEHYWGYTKMNKNQLGEYEVYHPKWEIHPVIDYQVECDLGGLYGTEFSLLTPQKPASVFLAEGSAIEVYPKKVL